MEITWSAVNVYLGLLFFEFCYGLPVNLENKIAESHTQLLTGLVAVLLTICSVVFLAGCLCCQRRKGFKEFRDSPVIASSTSNIDHGHINPVANGEFTIFTPLSPPHQNNNVFLANQQIITRTEEDFIYDGIDVSSWFNGTDEDFPRIKLKYIREIGKGWFGRVVEGTAQDIINNQSGWTPVAVRILEATANNRERILFLNDAAIYRYGNHPNILKLMGRCLDTIPLLLLQEYCSQGCLKKYLIENKTITYNLLTNEYILVWCCQLTSALKYLHDNKLTHPDLATRNCQLTTDLILKLGDYGLGVFNYPNDYYQGSPGIPIRWSAPESVSYTTTTIQSNKITPEANIWSLAVTLWEICEFGAQPYSILSDDEVISNVLGGQNIRLPKPNCSMLYTDYIFRLMQLCWTSSESRPAVSQIDLMLTDLLQVHKNTTKTDQITTTTTLEDFDRRWESFKPNTIVKTDNHHIIDLIEENDLMNVKKLSPSLNNLHGSLDNLLLIKNSIEPTTTIQQQEMESWLENVANKTGDMLYVKGLSEAIQDLDNTLALENASSSDSSPGPNKLLGFNLNKSESPPNPTQTCSNFNNTNDSLTDSLLFVQRPTTTTSSSESDETEDENWKNKIERGVYTEKVRQKSRSVADLMVLTHIDYSESESETPLPSLDYRINFNNKTSFNKYSTTVTPKQNLENVSLKFGGSEGNLLNVQDTFEQELKKLQEERRDCSLLFVPESNNNSQSNSSVVDNDNKLLVSNETSNTKSLNLNDSPSKRLIHELNSTSEIKPVNQVYNVFNVTINNNNTNKYSPVHNCKKLNEIINFNTENVQVPKLSEIIQNNSEFVEILNNKSQENEENNQIINSNCISPSTTTDNDISLSYINLTDEILNNLVVCDNDRKRKDESNNKSEEILINNKMNLNTTTTTTTTNKFEEDIYKNLSDDLKLLTKNKNFDNLILDYNKHINFSTTANEEEETKNETCIVLSNNNKVPTLVDLIQNNDELMDYIIAKYETENLTDKDNNTTTNQLTDNNKKTIKESKIDVTKNFLLNEIKNYDDCKIFEYKKIEFNLNEVGTNFLTINNTSTPFTSKKSLQELSHEDDYSSLNLFVVNNNLNDSLLGYHHGNDLKYSLETWDNFLGNALDDQNNKSSTTVGCGDGEENGVFDSFNSEPQSLLFLENVNNELTSNNDDNNKEDSEMIICGQQTENETYIVDKSLEKDTNAMFTVDLNDVNLILEDEDNDEDEIKNEDIDNSCTRKSGGGWFLHPQSNKDDTSGERDFSQNTDSYVGFDMDDEIMAAIRNELLTKLPHAQGASNDKIYNTDDWDSSEKNEVFLTYNVYATPLSPIPEESLLENNSIDNTPKQIQSDNEDDSDWSEACDDQPEIESHTSPIPHASGGPSLHRHTPSQDSCCSNDTLFNLEEITNHTTDHDYLKEEKIVLKQHEIMVNHNNDDSCDNVVQEGGVSQVNIKDNDVNNKTIIITGNDNSFIMDLDEENIENKISLEMNEQSEENEYNKNYKDLTYVTDFLDKEKQYCSNTNNKIVIDSSEETECSSDNSTLIADNTLLPFLTKQIAPLPSPEDKPWKQLPASLLTYDKIILQTNNTNNNNTLLPVVSNELLNLEEDNKNESFVDYVNIKKNETEEVEEEEEVEKDYENLHPKELHYANINNVYENVLNVNDIYNEADYVNIVNLENMKNTAEFQERKIEENDSSSTFDVNDFNQFDELIINTNEDQDDDDEDDDDVYGVLTDIRFSGPSDNQLMTTSFSESNDLNDEEQDWDSGSDTRSSSSGEFIWKEGEHEESLKALHAVPQDALDDIKPMEDIQEETTSESSGSDEEGESPEFVPSAWDKYATPTKSALRSPEKILEKNEKKKSKGVWFKKQKYHCVYEYPREPESPILQSYDLWKPQQDNSMFADWDLDLDNNTPQDTSDDIENSYNYYKPKINRNLNLYQLINIPDFVSSSSGMDDEFFISSSARPFDMIQGLSSQFFPGNNNTKINNNKTLINENITPDSGVEDITPADVNTEFSINNKMVQSLKILASNAIKKNNNKKEEEIRNNNSNNDVLGGLRHTRNKLKLDLPPSPNAFHYSSNNSNNKFFSIESTNNQLLDDDLVINREKPTFTTFGKSRFFVQQVDTPPEDELTKCKNVSFEALPYKPLIETHIIRDDFNDIKLNNKGKVEIVRGEASLLDSADEDSGIESSTLDRKIIS